MSIRRRTTTAPLKPLDEPEPVPPHRPIRRRTTTDPLKHAWRPPTRRRLRSYPSSNDDGPVEAARQPSAYSSPPAIRRRTTTAPLMHQLRGLVDASLRALSVVERR